MSVDVDAFAHGLEGGDRRSEIARELWGILRDEAFVADFRPDPNDDLAKVYAMGPEEVRDELIEPLLTRLGLSVSGIDFTGFDFSSITTPRGVSRFVVKVADAQGREGKQRIKSAR
ncbi:MAG TPA: hypothetical protein VFT56_17335 [Sphingomonas sp.]|nr:hypothetical protein [Sphingomonas sp.]